MVPCPTVRWAASDHFPAEVARQEALCPACGARPRLSHDSAFAARALLQQIPEPRRRTTWRSPPGARPRQPRPIR